MLGFRPFDYIVLLLYFVLNGSLLFLPLSLTSVIILYIGMTIICLEWAVWNRKDPIEHTLPKASIGRTVAMTFFYFLLALLLQVVINLLLIYGLGIEQKAVTNSDEIESIINMNKWFVIVVVVSAPIIEEVIFRGILFRRLALRGFFWPGLLTSSILFAAGHLMLTAFITFMLLGILLAMLYHRTQRFWAPIGLHFLINSTTMFALLTSS